jgi:5-methylcytosine-specific restriction endonuclease McrA
MIRITRAELPDSVSDRLSALTKRVGEAEDAKRAAEAPRIWRLASTRAHVHVPLDDILRQMAPGLGQCMYCGETGTGIDHFEPVSRNPLRTFDWLNHLLACATCNSQAKGDAFPADAHGQPLLIDPTAEDPFDHLRLSLPFGRYEPLTGSVLGAEENRAVSYDTENGPAEDLSRGNSLTGDLGIGVSAVCGLLDRFKVADC